MSKKSGGLMHATECMFCLVLIALRTGPSIGQDSSGKDVVNIKSVEATELGKLEISWELKAGTENVDEFRIQLEACPSSGSCYQESMMYIKSQGLFTAAEIECKECRRYLVRVTAVDVARDDVGESGTWASFKVTDKDIADSHPTSEAGIEFTKEVKVATEVPSDPDSRKTPDGSSVFRNVPEPTETGNDTGSTDEKKDMKDMIIYALTPLLAVLAIALAVLAICLVKQRSKQELAVSEPIPRQTTYETTLGDCIESNNESSSVNLLAVSNESDETTLGDCIESNNESSSVNLFAVSNESDATTLGDCIESNNESSSVNLLTVSNESSSVNLLAVSNESESSYQLLGVSNETIQDEEIQEKNVQLGQFE